MANNLIKELIKEDSQKSNLAIDFPTNICWNHLQLYWREYNEEENRIESTELPLYLKGYESIVSRILEKTGNIGYCAPFSSSNRI